MKHPAMKTVSEAISAQIRYLGYQHPLEWLTTAFDYETFSLSFDASRPKEGGRVPASKIVKRDQIADFKKILADPNLRTSYRYIIAEEAGIDHARQAAANMFMEFMRRYLLEATRSRELKPPRWVTLDNEMQQALPPDCGALFLDNYSFNSTAPKGEKVRYYLAQTTHPVFLICSGATPYQMIAEKLNTSFDAYLYLRTELARSL